MFEDRTVLITGAASGLGRAWAKGFSADGATVIAVDINREGLDEVPAAFHLQVDVGNAAEVKQMIVEHQGYMKGLEACNENCEVK